MSENAYNQSMNSTYTNTKSLETYTMFFKLACAMYKQHNDRDILRGFAAYKMTRAFYGVVHGATNRFEAAFKADNLDFHSAIRALESNAADSNPDWVAAMKAIQINHDERVQEEFA